MRIFSLDFDDCASGSDVTVWDLDNSDDCGCDIVIYLPGPPGPPGPPGTGDQIVVVTATGDIPEGQTYTIVQGSAPTIQTLPLIADVLIGATGSPYTVVNVTSHLVQVEPSGGDAILVGDPVNEPFINTSFSFLPTPLGWVII